VNVSEDHSGSKPVSLEVSKCFPVCPRKRTFDLRVNDYTSRGHPAARTELILTVDDNPTVLATTVLQLEALGYQTLAAHNAETALEMLDRDAKVDVLFTDIVMPGTMNGKELAKLARIKRPGLKVVYASGFPGVESTAGIDVDLDPL
jgi:CheY-like chemotaxis protein